MNAVESYQALYWQLAEQLPGHEVAWVRAMRETALQHFAELGFPTRKQEAWKYTQLQALEKNIYHPTTSQQQFINNDDCQQLPLATLDAYKLVFVDGHFNWILSDINPLPDGVVINELSNILNSQTKQQHPIFPLTQQTDDVLNALNNAFITTGAAINILADVQLEKPIHLQYINTIKNKSASYSRNVVIMEPNSHAQLIESHVALGEGDYVNNVQVDIQLETGAQLQHYKLQLEGQSGMHFSETQVELASDSHYQNHLFAFGSQLMRNNIKTKLNGARAGCLLNGLFISQSKQHLEMRTHIDHHAPSCTSRETYRGIANDKSHGVFDGTVVVHPHAQKSDARVTTNNLLLSQGSEIDAKPQLEIYADDVKCSHGATIGQLDEEVLYYLRSRGIDEATSRNLMLFAFANHIIEQCPMNAFQSALHGLLLKQLQSGDQLQELLK